MIQIPFLFSNPLAVDLLDRWCGHLNRLFLVGIVTFLIGGSSVVLGAPLEIQNRKSVCVGSLSFLSTSSILDDLKQKVQADQQDPNPKFEHAEYVGVVAQKNYSVLRVLNGGIDIRPPVPGKGGSFKLTGRSKIQTLESGDTRIVNADGYSYIFSNDEKGDLVLKEKYLSIYDFGESSTDGLRHSIGRWLLHLDATTDIVEFNLTDLVPVYVAVPRNAIYKLRSGTAANFESKIKPLLDLSFPFEPNERIRFRTKNGSISSGRFISLQNNLFMVEGPDRMNQEVSRQNIFRSLNNEPKNITFKDSARMVLNKAAVSKSPLLQKLLDGAAKLSSLSDFSTLSIESQIRTLVIYLQSNVTWTDAALDLEMNGFDSFDGVLASGAGVCRHLAVMTALIMGEAGFDARLVSADSADLASGHAWVDVTKSTGEVLVVDPSLDGYKTDTIVMSYKLLEEYVHKNKVDPFSQFASKFYLNPNRRIESEQQVNEIRK